MNNEIEEVLTCPLGSDCKKIIDGKIHRCKWLINIRGENPQTGENDDMEECAIAFTPIAILENARWARGTQAAVEEERNEVSKLNKAFQIMLRGAAEKSQELQHGTREQKVIGEE